MRSHTVAVAFSVLVTLAAAGVFGEIAPSRYADESGEADYSASSDVGLVVMDGGPTGVMTIDVSAAGEPTMLPNSGFVMYIDADRCKTTGGTSGYEYQIAITGSTMSAQLSRWSGTSAGWQPASAPSLTWFWASGPKVTIAGSELGALTSFNFVLATSRLQNFGGGDLRPYFDYAPNIGTWVYPQDAPPVAPCGIPEPSPAPADTTPPNTRLLASPAARTAGRSASFRFASTEAGSTFRCKLDRRAWARCRSGITYRRLARGTHVFRVRAIDATGNADRTPATRTWRIT